MRHAFSHSIVLTLLILGTVGNDLVAQEAAGRPGVISRIGGLRDALLNRGGNRPGRERTPPRKALSDPAFLDSDALEVAELD